MWPLVGSFHGFYVNDLSDSGAYKEPQVVIGIFEET